MTEVDNSARWSIVILIVALVISISSCIAITSKAKNSRTDFKDCLDYCDGGYAYDSIQNVPKNCFNQCVRAFGRCNESINVENELPKYVPPVTNNNNVWNANKQYATTQ